MKKTKVTQASLIIGIIAMLLLILGTITEGGSLLQKILFVIGAPVLGITAYLNKQKMFAVLQSLITVGALLAFFSNILSELKYVIMFGAATLGIGYLVKTKHYSKDPFGILGSLGLAFIAIGFATNPVQFPRIFGFLLGAGGISVAIYSAISFFHYKIRISIIWLILNVIFSINPILLFLASL